MEEMKGTLCQNAINEFRAYGRFFRHSPRSFLLASTYGVVFGVILGKGLLVPILREMEEDRKIKRMNVKIGNLKTDA